MVDVNGGPVGRTRTRGVLLLGVVFVLGMVCGAALFFLGARSVMRSKFAGFERHAGRPPMMRLFRELNLDDAQREQVRSILRRSQMETREIVERSREEIREILRPEQEEIFDRLPRHHPAGPGRDWPDRGRRRSGRRHPVPPGDGPPPEGPPPDGAPPPEPPTGG